MNFPRDIFSSEAARWNSHVIGLPPSMIYRIFIQDCWTLVQLFPPLAFTVHIPRLALKGAITKTWIEVRGRRRAGWVKPGLSRRPLQGSSRCYRSTGGREGWPSKRVDVRARSLGPPQDSEVAARTAMHHPIFSYRRLFLVHCPLSGFWVFSDFFLSLERDRERLVD